MAQIVNVIAPLFTNAETVIRQSIVYPYQWALESARGASLDVRVETDA